MATTHPWFGSIVNMQAYGKGALLCVHLWAPHFRADGTEAKEGARPRDFATVEIEEEYIQLAERMVDDDRKVTAPVNVENTARIAQVFDHHFRGEWFGASPDAQEAKLIAVRCTDWEKDPYYRCSYTECVQMKHEAAADITNEWAMPEHGAIFFAGEHASREDPGNVAGAYSSGPCSSLSDPRLYFFI